MQLFYVHNTESVVTSTQAPGEGRDIPISNPRAFGAAQP